MAKYAYFPGCNLKSDAKGFEDSALAVSKTLGGELVELEKWNCCGTVHTMTEDNLMKRIAPVRILGRTKNHIEKTKISPGKVVTLCSMCNSTLKVVNTQMKEDEDKLDTINYMLEEDQEEYDGTIDVKHYLEILRDEIGFNKIKAKVKKPLKGLKISPYYGCMLLHPDEAQIDDQEKPSVLENTIASLGGEVIRSPYFKYCCGSYHVLDQEDTVKGQVERIVGAAKKRGANAIAVACPLCAFNLDKKQTHMLKGDNEGLPIFYFTQLMAIALGEKEDVNHFDDHAIDPRILLKKLGLM